MKNNANLVNPFQKAGALDQKDEKLLQETKSGHTFVTNIS